jgi:hypothetical protein
MEACSAGPGAQHQRGMLSTRRSEWTALGPVIEVMGFDFYDAEANMAPIAAELMARITAPGVWNAVAFWFELQLDENTRLNSGPYCEKVHDTSATELSS